MKIGWVGAGVMGGPMAGHLVKAGHTVTLTTRTRARADALVAAGARWADDPSAAARGAEAVGLMVGFPEDVEEVVFGPRGVMTALAPGALLIDFTTSRPGLARRIAAAAAARGASAIDAPVSGGDVGAREARLSIMAGGDRAAFDRARPLLERLGTTVVYQGPAGAGQHTKMVNQILIAGTMIGLCEALLYARKAELDPEAVLRSVGGGAAASWSLANLYPRLLKHDLQPGFYVKHFIKDLQIALDEAARMELELPGLRLARALYARTAERGGENLGTQALILALDETWADMAPRQARLGSPGTGKG